MTSNHSAMSRFLARLISRSSLNREERDAILRLSFHTEQKRPNFDIVTPGETVSHACLVAHGLAARYDQMADGKRQNTAFYWPGDMCDLHSVVCPTAGWGIVALTTTTILKVPHQELCDIANKYPAIAMAFWRDGTVDASILAKWVGNLGRRDARARIAHLLCECGLRMEEIGLGTRTCFNLDVSQQQLGDSTGLTPVHVNRTLQALRGEKIISSAGRMVHVDDWKRLSEIAEFNSDYLLFGAANPDGPTKIDRGPEPNYS